jgi:hypothetical protein
VRSVRESAECRPVFADLQLPYRFASPNRLNGRCTTAGGRMKIEDDLVGPAKLVWHLLIERTAALRPELFRYCPSLTGPVSDCK